MAKKEAKAVSYRLREDTVSRLGELAGQWECSQTQALERGIEMAYALVMGGEPVEEEPRITPGERPSRDALQGMINEMQGHATGIDLRPKTARCKHCGKAFPGARGSTLCIECATAKHRGDPANCPECTAGEAL